MKALKTPIRFTGGRLRETSDLRTIIKQKIIDVLVTAKYERVMRPNYGAGVYSYLYEIMDPLVFADFKSDAIMDIQDSVSGVTIIDINIAMGDGNPLLDTGAVEITVLFKAPMVPVSSISFQVSEFLSDSEIL